MDPGEKEDVRRSHQCTVSALQRMRAGHYRAAVGNKETLAAIAARYKINRSNIHNKIKLLEEDYASFRRIRQDGNNFYRSFMFSYLERVMEKQDSYESDRVLKRILRCRRMNAILGGHEYTFDELAQELKHVLKRIIRGAPNSMSPDEFLLNCLDEHALLNVMIFFRLVTSIEIHMNSNYYRPKMHAKYRRSMEEFVLEQDMIVDFETDQLRVKALSEALGIPTKVVQFDVLAPVPEIPKSPYCFFDGSSCRNFNLGLLSDDFVLISGSKDEHAVPATGGPPSPASSVSDAEDVGSASDYDSGIILDLTGPSYVTLVFWRGHYGVLYRNSVLTGLMHDFF